GDPLYVLLIYQDAVYAGLNHVGGAADARAYRGNAARRGLHHGDRRRFAETDARQQEDVRRLQQSTNSFLREWPDELDAIAQSKTNDVRLDGAPIGPLSGDRIANVDPRVSQSAHRLEREDVALTQCQPTNRDQVQGR